MLIVDKPIIVYLQITPSCQYKCVGCTNSFASGKMRRKGGPTFSSVLSITDWREVLQTIMPFVGRVILTGGEPTAYEHFDTLIESLTDWRIPFSILTNGDWENPGRIVKILSGNSWFGNLHVSLCAADAVNYKKYTGIDGFNRVVENIKYAIDAGLKVSTGTVISKWNYNKTREIVDLCNSLNVHQINFDRYIGIDWAGVKATPEQFACCVKDINALKRENKKISLGACIPQCFEINSSTGCLAGQAVCTIDPWGNVSPCIHTSWVCGNILYEGLDHIWCSPTMHAWRNLIPNDCRSCYAFSHCKGGCRADICCSGKDRDQLMTTSNRLGDFFPISDVGCVVLPRRAKIVHQYKILKSNKGYALYKGSLIAFVKTDAIQILHNIKNDNDALEDIKKKYGEVALSMIGHLLRKQLITLYL